MVVVAHSLEVGNLVLGVGTLEEDPEADNHGPGAGNLDLGVGRRVHFVRSSHQRVRGHQDQHRLERHENLLKLVLCFTLIQQIHMPAGFLSSSSMSSFIFFLRKSMILTCYLANVELVCSNTKRRRAG
jgi:hypothetical protein